MIRFKKKIWIYILIVTFSFSTISPLCVIASDTNKGIKPTTEWSPSEWVKICYYLGNKIGFVGEAFAGAVQDWCAGNFTAEGLSEKFDDFKSGISVKNGKVLVSTNAMNALKGLTDAYIEDCGAYCLISTYSSLYDLYGGESYSSIKYMNDKNSFILWLKTITPGDLVVHSVGGSSSGGASGGIDTTFVIDDTERYFVGNIKNSSVVSYNSQFLTKPPYNRYVYNYNEQTGKKSFEFKDTLTSNSTDYYIVKIKSGKLTALTSDGRKVKVFKSIISLQDYLQGNYTTNIYVSNNYMSYDTSNDNSMEINNEILNEYIFNDNSTYTQEVTQVVNNVTNTINNYYTTNGSTMTQADIQAAIDRALEDFLNSLPSGGGEEPTEPETPSETETETETGGDISGNDVSGNGVDGPKTVGLLQKILNKLTEFFNFAKGGLIDALNGIRGDIQSLSGNSISGNSVSGNGTDGAESVSLLQKILDKLQEIKWAIAGDAVTGGLGDLLSVALDKITDLADSVKDTAVSIVPEIKDMVSDVIDGTEETIGKMVGNVGTSMRPVGDKMKTKFPFSIPWDIAAVVSSMAATPETPVFEIPIVFERYDIDYTFTLDMSDFEVISKISRLFLSLTFVLFLTKLTVQVVKMEKEL